MRHLLTFALVLAVMVLCTTAAVCRIRSPQLDGFADSTILDYDTRCSYDQPSFASTNRVVLYYDQSDPDSTAAVQYEFGGAATQAAQAGLDVAFVSVDADTQTSNGCIAYKMDRQAAGLPLVLFESGSAQPPYPAFSGSHDASSILGWVRTMPPCQGATCPGAPAPQLGSACGATPGVLCPPGTCCSPQGVCSLPQKNGPIVCVGSPADGPPSVAQCARTGCKACGPSTNSFCPWTPDVDFCCVKDTSKMPSWSGGASNGGVCKPCSQLADAVLRDGIWRYNADDGWY